MYQKQVEPGDRLLKPAEVAELFRVDPKTVTRWAKAGWLSAVITPGGHRRYLEVEVLGMLDQSRTAVAGRSAAV